MEDRSGAAAAEGSGGQALRLVKRSLLHYGDHSATVHKRVESQIAALDPRYRAILPDQTGHLATLRSCLAANAELLQLIGDVAPHELFLNQEDTGAASAQQTVPSEVDMDRVRGLLRQISRDWSSDGGKERKDCYQPLLRELESTYPLASRGSVRVLVPGCGSGRLPWEIMKLGFCSQGNECSAYALLSADFIMNRCSQRESHKLYPYCHQTTNVMKRADQIREVRVPDVCPATEASDQDGDLSIVAGDFVQVYHKDAQEGKWGCVVTCFFIDTARNIFEYLETIYNVLPVGGRWMNLGPLLYHYTDAGGALELAYDDLRAITAAYGFDVVKEEVVQSTYNANEQSMLQVVYRNAFFHAVKSGRKRSLDQLPKSLPSAPLEHEAHPVAADDTTVLKGVK